MSAAAPFTRESTEDQSGTDLDITVTRKVKDGKAADIAEAIDVHGKLAEKVDNGGGALGQGVPEDPGRDEHRNEFVAEEDELEGEQGAKSPVDLRRVELSPPLCGKIVGFGDNLLQEPRRLHPPPRLVVGHSPPGPRENGPENTQIKEHGAIRRDLEMEKGVGVDEGQEDEDRGERAR